MHVTAMEKDIAKICLRMRVKYSLFVVYYCHRDMNISKDLVIKKLDNEYIIMSTISLSIIKFDKEGYENFSKCNFDYFEKDKLDYLKNNFFIIDEDVSSKSIKEFLMDNDRLNQKVFSSYIAFSTLCNFACVYCFEEGQSDRKKIMSLEVLDNVINWYEKKIIENNYSKIRVELFGGEPLIHKDLIKIFITKLNDVIKKHHCELEIGIVTNGYLLDNDIVNFLNMHGLYEIQITIDGVGEVHDKRRPLRNGKGTFDIIMNNVKNLNKFNGRILFRVSFDENNINDVETTLLYLSKLKLNNEHEIYIAPIHQTKEQVCNKCSYCSRNVNDDSKKMISLYKRLFTYMKSIGLKIPKYYTNGPCMFVSKDTVLINQLGDLYKCVEMIDIKDLSVGNVMESNYNGLYYNFTAKPLFKKCIEKDCKYVCLCGGGCAMQSIVENKNNIKLQCEYEYFEELLPFLMELNYGKK